MSSQSQNRKLLTSVVLQGLQLYLLQWYQVLFVVLFLADYDVAVHEDVVEQEELPGLWTLAAHLCEDALADQDTSRNVQWLARAAEAVFHHLYSAGVCLRVYCKQKKM